MNDVELAVVLDSLRPSPDGVALVGADPVLCARALEADGVAVSLSVSPGWLEPVWCSRGASARLEDLQFTVGEGPGLDVAASGAPVLECDLARVSADRWPLFLPEVLATGVGALCCLPLCSLQRSGACIGTLTLQCSQPGRLGVSALARAGLLADALASMLLEDGAAWDDLREVQAGSYLSRAVVHQAAGVISAQAHTGVDEALLRLRAQAFRHGRPLAELAQDVVSGRTNFRPL